MLWFVNYIVTLILLAFLTVGLILVLSDRSLK